MSPLMVAAVAFAVALLACFTLRRAVFMAAALAPPRPFSKARSGPPSVTLLVPASDESSRVDATLDALGQLQYPRERLFTVLVSDGSRDSTDRRMQAWATGRARTLAIALPTRVGKFEALNQGIRAAPPAEVIAVCDADLRPHPSWLRRLVRPFGDPAVGATAGLLSPVNADRGIVARYAAVESWVHQLVTSAAKDRLGLNPPTLGACAYRRAALESAGWFSGAGSGGDVRISAELARSGWRIRFAADAIADNAVVDRWDHYWHQHVRWARNLFATARVRPRASGPAPVGLARRIECWMAAAGYTDRVALLAVSTFTLAGLLPLWVPATYVAVVVAEVAVAVARAGASRRLPAYLASAATLLAVDVVASAVAMLAHLLGRPQQWRAARNEVRTSAEA